MQVELKNDTAAGYALLLGDHCYPTLKRIFEISETETLQWNVVAPHHCSKSAMCTGLTKGPKRHHFTRTSWI